jgi:hypothetical protein
LIGGGCTGVDILRDGLPGDLKEDSIANREWSGLRSGLAVAVGYDDVVRVLIVGGGRGGSGKGVSTGRGARDGRTGRLSRRNYLPRIREGRRAGSYDGEGGSTARSDRLADGLSDDGGWNIARRDRECGVGGVE